MYGHADDYTSLLMEHGSVNTLQVTEDIEKLAGVEIADINFINREASKGKLFISVDNKVIKESIEGDGLAECKHKIVPLGYECKDTGMPLNILFDNKAFVFEGSDSEWISGEVGTLETLLNNKSIEITKELYQLIKRYSEINGNGLDEVLKYNGSLMENLDKAEELETEKVLSLMGTYSVTEENTDVTSREAVVTSSDTDVTSRDTDVTEEETIVTSRKAVVTSSDTVVTEENAVVKEETVYDAIYKVLKTKSIWVTPDRADLAKYIKEVNGRVYNQVARNTNNYWGPGYMLSEDKKCACINTGLLDVFGNYVYIVNDDIRGRHSCKKEESLNLVKGQLELLDYGFNPKHFKNMPRKLEDFHSYDLQFTGGCTSLRADKTLVGSFVGQCKNEEITKLKSADRIAKVIASIEENIHRAEAENSWAVPSYKSSRATIQWLVPVYVDTEDVLGQVPDFVAAIEIQGKEYVLHKLVDIAKGYGMAKTIIEYDNHWVANIRHHFLSGV